MQKSMKLICSIMALNAAFLLHAASTPIARACDVMRKTALAGVSNVAPFIQQAPVEFTVGSADTLKMLVVSPVFSDTTFAELSLLNNAAFVAAVMQAVHSQTAVSFSTAINPAQATAIVSAYNASTKALIATQTFVGIQVSTPNQSGTKPLSSTVTVSQLNLVFQSSSMAQAESKTIASSQAFTVIQQQAASQSTAIASQPSAPAPTSLPAVAPFVQTSSAEFSMVSADTFKMLVISPVFSDRTFAEFSLLSNATFVDAVMQAVHSQTAVSFSTAINPAQATAVVSVYNASTKALIATQTFAGIQVSTPNQSGTKPLSSTVTVSQLNLVFQSSSMAQAESKTIAPSQAFTVIQQQVAPQTSASTASLPDNQIYLTTSDITTLTVVAIGGNLALPSSYFFNTFGAIQTALAANKQVVVTINSTSKTIQTSATTATEALIVGAPYLVIAQDSAGSVQTLVTNDGSFLLSGPVAGKASTQTTLQADQLVLNSKLLKGLVVYALNTSQGSNQDAGYAIVPSYFPNAFGNIVSQISKLASGQAVEVSLDTTTKLMTITAPSYSGIENLLEVGPRYLVLASTLNAQNQLNYYVMLLPVNQTMFNISFGSAVALVAPSVTTTTAAVTSQPQYPFGGLGPI